MPSILAKADRYVLRYFRKYGFQDVTLTLLILEPGSSFEMALELEQYCMDMLSPKLNVDMVASSSPCQKNGDNILESYEVQRFLFMTQKLPD